MKKLTGVLIIVLLTGLVQKVSAQDQALGANAPINPPPSVNSPAGPSGFLPPAPLSQVKDVMSAPPASSPPPTGMAPAPSSKEAQSLAGPRNEVGPMAAASPAPNSPQANDPLNSLPAPRVFNPASHPPAPFPSANKQPEAAQFQKWLQGSTSQENLRLTGAPPPPSVGGPPPPPKLVIKKKPRIIHMQKGPDAPLVESPPLTYEEEKQIMLGMAPPSAVPPNPDSDVAFNSMMQQNVPLTPQQVIRLRQLIDTSQRAAAVPATIPPKPVSTTLMINLAPGSTPPAIRLAQGYISSLVFVDSTGAPWPVAAYDIGDPKIVTIQWDGKSNIMMMQATSPYSTGNLVIRLAGLETPVTLELVSGQRVVDYRTDIHVPGIGPNAKDLPTGTGLPESANQLLLNVLDGVAPPGSRQLVVTGGDCQAWLLGDKMFLRTRFTVLSPGWIGKMSSPDGMMAYEIQRTSSVLISQYGNPIELKVEGF